MNQVESEMGNGISVPEASNNFQEAYKDLDNNYQRRMGGMDRDSCEFNRKLLELCKEYVEVYNNRV
jgi:hypothetical protein